MQLFSCCKETKPIYKDSGDEVIYKNSEIIDKNNEKISLLKNSSVVQNFVEIIQPEVNIKEKKDTSLISSVNLTEVIQSEVAKDTSLVSSGIYTKVRQSPIFSDSTTSGIENTNQSFLRNYCCRDDTSSTTISSPSTKKNNTIERPINIINIESINNIGALDFSGLSE